MGLGRIVEGCGELGQRPIKLGVRDAAATGLDLVFN
jgi:hypothetical protein